ncbi:MAG: hypothetical protein COU85_00685 [Candidatus Portnoybacteria bacterium CG10_big_fil_rev_8_21_14_0_10_44_7]|uniref:PEGA domain-containing protein n=1 Tax=Candidatus Portnoybacteria bacterium CG10_big_fil_rev_8_21_14_0_10_44_7 TaxID=1974816 RepID=A0A2M8KJA9_9BACT|nr:MAG: hypothetical protein COU85_00685 [Candidatus Portnoybacteria bacterium CG10_big_fil_rev_8_21_14_0_10_44_7]
MTKRIRRILFWSIVAIFIMVTPLFFAYSFGYFFDFSQWHWIKTGSIYLGSSPSGAQVYLNDKLAAGKTPVLLKHLKPGHYTIRIVKDSFASWEKTVGVVSYQVTEFRQIFLPQKEPALSLVGATEAKKMLLFVAPAEKMADAQNYLNQQKINYTGLTLDSDKFYFLKKPGLTLFQKNFTDTDKPQQLSLTNLDTCDCSLGEPQIILGAKGKISLITPEKDLLLLDNQDFRLVQRQVKAAGFDQWADKLFISTLTNELWVYFLAPTGSQPFHSAGENIFLTRFSTPIGAVAWYLDNHQILFEHDHRLKMIEIDNRDSKNIFDLLPVRDTEIFADFNAQKIYLKNENQIYSLGLKKT